MQVSHNWSMVNPFEFLVWLYISAYKPPAIQQFLVQLPTRFLIRAKRIADT